MPKATADTPSASSQPPADRGEVAAEHVRRLVEGAKADEQPNGHAPGVELQVADRQLVSDTAMLVRLVDQDRFDQLAAADRRCIGDLKDLLAKAITERDGDGTRQLVSVDVVGQVLAAARQWAAARGLNGNGSGGSA